MYSKNELIKLYKKETNPKVKERLFFVIKVNMIISFLPTLVMNYIEVDLGDHIGGIGSYNKE